jgi:hypothetical protein
MRSSAPEASSTSRVGGLAERISSASLGAQQASSAPRTGGRTLRHVDQALGEEGVFTPARARAALGRDLSMTISRCRSVSVLVEQAGAHEALEQPLIPGERGTTGGAQRPAASAHRRAWISADRVGWRGRGEADMGVLLCYRFHSTDRSATLWKK